MTIKEQNMITTLKNDNKNEVDECIVIYQSFVNAMLD